MRLNEIDKEEDFFNKVAGRTYKNPEFVRDYFLEVYKKYNNAPTIEQIYNESKKFFEAEGFVHDRNNGHNDFYHKDHGFLKPHEFAFISNTARELQIGKVEHSKNTTSQEHRYVIHFYQNKFDIEINKNFKELT